MNSVPYTVLRCRKENAPDGTPRLYGPAHGSWTGNETLCGLQTDENWYIATNTFDGQITCKACQATLRPHEAAHE